MLLAKKMGHMNRFVLHDFAHNCLCNKWRERNVLGKAFEVHRSDNVVTASSGVYHMSVVKGDRAGRQFDTGPSRLVSRGMNLVVSAKLSGLAQHRSIPGSKAAESS